MLRVRLTVRGGRAGQRWNIFMDHNRTGFFAGYRISGEAGAWVVRRRVSNLAGTDWIRFGAHNVATGRDLQRRSLRLIVVGSRMTKVGLRRRPPG